MKYFSSLWQSMVRLARGHVGLKMFKASALCSWPVLRCLLMYATLLDGPAQVYFAPCPCGYVCCVTEEIEEDLGELMALLFLLFIFISAFTVMNMLIGILCEASISHHFSTFTVRQVVNKVSETEKEEA